jgi:hypothetical protein
VALSIKNPKTDRLARRLARRTRESLTEAVTRAVEQRLWRVNCRTRYGAPRSPNEINARAEQSLSRLRRAVRGVEGR